MTARIRGGVPRRWGSAILTRVRRASWPGHSVPAGHSQATQTLTLVGVVLSTERVTATGTVVDLQPSSLSAPPPVLSA